MEQHTHNTIADILQKIEQKKISVHSKTFFRVRLFIFTLLLVAICVTSILLCSFIVFTIRMTGQSDFIGFGSQGIKLLFILFPWILFLLDVLLIGVLALLMRHVSFGYRIPGVYVLSFMLCVIVISGYIVASKTSFHYSMLDRADKKQLPLFRDAYRKIRMSPPVGYEIYKGSIVKKEDNIFLVDIDDTEGRGTTSSIFLYIQDMTRVSQIEVGDSVFISGKIVNGQMHDAQLKRAPRLPRPF